MNEDETANVINQVIDKLDSIEHALNLPAVNVAYDPDRIIINVEMGGTSASVRLTPEQMRHIVNEYCIEHNLYLAQIACAQGEVPL
jgi:hypothetical protein